MTYHFVPSVQTVNRVSGLASISDLEKEIGVYSATPEFVRKHCGPIANAILDKVPGSYFAEARGLGLYPNIDVRIHRLYPGDFSAYPGWHCDGEYRETYFAQPDLNRIKVHKHIICSVSSHEDGVSNTQFLMERYDHESDLEPGTVLWRDVDRVLCSERRKTQDAKDGELVMFDSWTLHRAMPARIRGWRLFFRMAMWHKPNLGEGKLTKQEQVYQILGEQGW